MKVSIELNLPQDTQIMEMLMKELNKANPTNRPVESTTTNEDGELADTTGDLELSDDQGTIRETDAKGIAWDARIHSGNKKCLASTGLWQRRKNVSDADYARITAEITPVVTEDTGTQTLPPPPPVTEATGTQTLPPPPPVTETTQTLPPPPPPVTETTTVAFDGNAAVVKVRSWLVKDASRMPKLKETLAAFGIIGYLDIAKDKDTAEAFLMALGIE